MAKTWVLDTGTKGTGAQMLPLEEVLPQPEAPAPKPRKRVEKSARTPAARPPRTPRPKGPVQTSSTPLAPGQVRKKSTGEIGKVQSVDPKAGTATVRWLKQGRTSTVPLTSITRR